MILKLGREFPRVTGEVQVGGWRKNFGDLVVVKGLQEDSPRGSGRGQLKVTFRWGTQW
jgi:hypothetical protein